MHWRWRVIMGIFIPRAQFSIPIEDRKVDIEHSGVAEDGEVLKRHVDPLLRVPVSEGEGLPRANMRKGHECGHRVEAPRVVAGIEVGLGNLDILGDEGVGLEVGDELIEGGVGVLHERGLGWVGTDALHYSAEVVVVDLIRRACDRLRGCGGSDDWGAEVQHHEAGKPCFLVHAHYGDRPGLTCVIRQPYGCLARVKALRTTPLSFAGRHAHVLPPPLFPV